MSIADREQAFADKIDCNFPYLDVVEAARLIAEAQSISANAEFIVLYEIVFPPPSEDLPKRIQQALLSAWREKATSPIAARIASMASRVLGGVPLATDEALAAMREVATIPQQYAALAVVSFLAYQNKEDGEHASLDALERDVRMRWEAE